MRSVSSLPSGTFNHEPELLLARAIDANYLGT